MSRALDELRALQERERAGGATLAQRRNGYLRKPELWELLVAACPQDPAYADAATNARHQLAELNPAPHGDSVFAACVRREVEIDAHSSASEHRG